MGFNNSRSVRVHDNLALGKPPAISGEGVINFKYKFDGKQVAEKDVSVKPRKSLKAKVLSRVFSEDYERVKKKILDPRGPALRQWNKIFLVSCLVSLFVDPLFFFLPVVRAEVCMEIGISLQVILTIIRTVADAFYVIQIYIEFRTAYVAPSSRVFGRGELVIDSSKIALRYLKMGFWIDFFIALPLPQVLNWLVVPNLRGSTTKNMRNIIRFIIIFQYLPRLFMIFPLSQRTINATGIGTETTWTGAVYNLMLFLLVSHVLGACWYLLAIERQEACWRSVCNDEKPSCQYGYFDCRSVEDIGRESWFQSSNITNLCDPSSSSYQFGMYGDAVNLDVTTATFFNKYFYGLWWGLRNMSSLGQNIITSTYPGENMYAILVGTLGLVLYALLIGNVQMYLRSTTVRSEEWRIKRADTTQWMHHRQLPPELRQSVRKYDHYKWIATRGVDEEALLKGLPTDLRRDIKRHICLDLVRRVPLFDEMDERMLDAICERLKPALCTEGTFLVREGYPVNEMLFIIRGYLDSYTTDGGRTGFFNSCLIGPGDFCGEELLTWALDPSPRVILPSSTRTVKSICEVEAFALRADDLKFVAYQFRRLHSKQLRHKFRFYSHQWRTWAACFIQVAWRRYKKRKEAAELRPKENIPAEPESSLPDSGLSIYVAKWAAITRTANKYSRSDSADDITLQKPAEPDFSVDEE